MLNSLKGTVTGKKENILLLETGGIEWIISCSSRTLSLVPVTGEEVKILIHLHQTQEAMSLFGFFSEEERKLFLELIKISGIGPKNGIKILSSISAEGFVKALESDDVALLSSLPGIGKKTAQKIILALRGKLLADDSDKDDNNPYRELAASLSDMGFDHKAALKAVKEISADVNLAGLDAAEKEKEIFRRAIVSLSS